MRALTSARLRDSPVHAVAGGVVKIAETFLVLGGTVALDHGQGLETMYLHMSKLVVEPGARVKKGEVIGYVGATGRANGPHLHWVVYVNGVPVNPQQWVALKACGSEKAKHEVVGRQRLKPLTVAASHAFAVPLAVDRAVSPVSSSSRRRPWFWRRPEC